MLSVFSVTGVFLLSLLILQALENPKGEYENYEEMEKAGLIKRGWLPEYFPKSAKKIQESNNLDTNEVWATFSFDKEDIKSIRAVCRSMAENSLGMKFVCPPYENRTVTVILRSNGTGEYYSHEQGI